MTASNQNPYESPHIEPSVARTSISAKLASWQHVPALLCLSGIAIFAICFPVTRILKPQQDFPPAPASWVDWLYIAASAIWPIGSALAWLFLPIWLVQTWVAQYRESRTNNQRHF
jgi:hypothetical protein